MRIHFANGGSHRHSIHFHGIHSARMDGVPGAGDIAPGEEFVYEFEARPFGCHLYHCHSVPLKRHIHKGLYGAFIIDPDPERHPEHREVARSRLLGSAENAAWQELVMVMNGFDTNFDEENEFYAVNTIPHVYAKKPIRDREAASGPDLPGQHHRVRPDQLASFACQLLRLLRLRHDADADPAHHRHRDAVPGAARHPRNSRSRTTSPACTCSMRTSRNSSSSAG